VTYPNGGNLAFGEGVIAPVADAGSIEALGDDSIVAKFEQLIDLVTSSCDVCFLLAMRKRVIFGYGRNRYISSDCPCANHTFSDRRQIEAQNGG
jgi:hypothetical protein